IPGVLTLPEALPAKSSTAGGGGNGGGGGGAVTAQTGGELGSDYGSDYDDEEPQKGPGNLAKATAMPKMPAPFFNQKAVDVYVPGNATSVKLECPVKNYDAERHVILWYKDDSQVSSGANLMNKIYSLDSRFSLTVPLTSNATEQRFSCSVMPPDVKRLVTIRFGPEPSTPAPITDSPPDADPDSDSGAPTGRDFGLWSEALLLAVLQMARISLF
ncbi:hypothetical protein KR009_006015, partial [Drosophila setifemur]